MTYILQFLDGLQHLSHLVDLGLAFVILDVEPWTPIQGILKIA